MSRPLFVMYSIWCRSSRPGRTTSTGNLIGPDLADLGAGRCMQHHIVERVSIPAIAGILSFLRQCHGELTFSQRVEINAFGGEIVRCIVISLRSWLPFRGTEYPCREVSQITGQSKTAHLTTSFGDAPQGGQCLRAEASRHLIPS